MEPWLARTARLLGEENMELLSRARVAVLGLGGVGSAAAEALCRSGVGRLLLADGDTVDDTNLNRQLVSTRAVVGMQKTDAQRLRLKAIRPGADFDYAREYYLPGNRDFLFDWKPDLIIDAVDMVTAKLDLACQCAERKIPLLCCLGTGGRLDPSLLRMGELRDTAGGCGCGLARVMRREAKKRGIRELTVLYSLETPAAAVSSDGPPGRHPPGSCAFVPPAAGMLLASFGTRWLLGMVPGDPIPKMRDPSFPP